MLGKAPSAVAHAEHSEHLRLANILDQMPVGIGIYDSLGQLFHSNRHFERAAGGAIPTIAAMSGRFWAPVSHDGVLIEEAAYPGARALNGHVATPGLDFVRRTGDGIDHWVSVSAVPLTTPGSAAVVGVVMVVEDAEERRRAMERLRTKDERFQRFARYSSNAIWIADMRSGSMDYLSPAAARIWEGYSAEDGMEALHLLIHPDDVAKVRENRAHVAHGQVRRFEYRMIGPRGEVRRHVRETSFPIPSDYGEGDCIGGIVEDVSPEYQLYVIGAEPQGEMSLLKNLQLPAHKVKCFAGGDDLVRVADVLNPGCVLVDLRGVPHDSAAISAILANKPADLQVILIGSADTSAREVLDGMRHGAADYLLEPLDRKDLEAAILKAWDTLPSRFDPTENDADLADRFTRLPRREREVLEGLVAGGTNKLIARQLGISPRTVEVHRAHLMERLNVRNLSELLQLSHRAGLGVKRG